MNQLGDLEKILAAAREFGASQQQELENLRAENESLKREINTLREENQKIYAEMNTLRQSKEDLRVANEAFSNNLNQLVNNLSANHEKAMTQINALVREGIQKFMLDFVNKARNNSGVTNSDSGVVVTANTAQKYSPTPDVVIVSNVDVVPANEGKPKIQYADFYAEEAAIEKDAGSEARLRALHKANRK